jgi:uridine phosphorylase
MSDEPSRDYESAERIQDAEGRQYHIGLAPGEVEPFILTVGDPARAERIAEKFDEPPRLRRSNREYLTFTGVCRGMPMSVMATGMGADNTEIAIVELAQIVENPTFIRVGTCGALQAEIGLGDLIISTGSVRLENTTSYFVHEGFPAIAHHEVITALIAAAEESERDFHTGITATAPGFYGAQGRGGNGFEPRFPDLPDQLAKMNVKNLEMETSALFTLAAMRGFRAGAVCAAIANRPRNAFIDKAGKVPAEDAAVEVALEAFRRLS